MLRTLRPRPATQQLPPPSPAMGQMHLGRATRRITGLDTARGQLRMRWQTTAREDHEMIATPLWRARPRALAPAGAVALASIPVFVATLASADAGRSSPDKPAVMLVHSAWAGGCTWGNVGKRLLAAG